MVRDVSPRHGGHPRSMQAWHTAVHTTHRWRAPRIECGWYVQYARPVRVSNPRVTEAKTTDPLRRAWVTLIMSSTILAAVPGKETGGGDRTTSSTYSPMQDDGSGYTATYARCLHPHADWTGQRRVRPEEPA